MKASLKFQNVVQENCHMYERFLLCIKYAVLPKKKEK